MAYAKEHLANWRLDLYNHSMELLTQSETLGTLFFALSVFHSFSVKQFQHWALKFPEGSVPENLLHLFGEVEVVFGIWAGALMLILAVWLGSTPTISFLEGLNFTEPLFVFVIMTVASTKPLLYFAQKIIDKLSAVIPIGRERAFLFTCLSMGPLLGSFITEPAAMTVTALLLKRRFFDRGISERLKYALLGVLFVNVSVGGTLTPYAAPPVLMVSGKWGWDLSFMLTHFGWRAATTVILNALAVAILFSKELASLQAESETQKDPMPFWIVALHLVFLASIVRLSHHPVVFLGVFLFFLGIVTITMEYQEELKIREGLLVGFFLGGLVILGGFQRWWLEPLLRSLNPTSMYFGASALTAVLDNAALTYLGSQVPNIDEVMKYALVAGAV
ncbi:MAG: hypothetical protein EBQ92_12980, partial [Proteobacteria bacterium]|nr:hypothetical protein [Pseudomonadota bacterium]